MKTAIIISSAAAFALVACQPRGFNSETDSVAIDQIKSNDPAQPMGYVWASFLVEESKNTPELAAISGISKKPFVMKIQRTYPVKKNSNECFQQDVYLGFDQRTELRDQICLGYWTKKMAMFNFAQRDIQNDFRNFCGSRENIGVNTVTSASFRAFSKIPAKYLEKMNEITVEPFLIMEKVVDLSGGTPDKRVTMRPDSTFAIEVPAEGSTDWRKEGPGVSYKMKNVPAQNMSVGLGLAAFFEFYPFIDAKPQPAEKVACPDSFKPHY